MKTAASILPSDSSVHTDGGKCHEYEFPEDQAIHEEMQVIKQMNQNRNDITGLAASSQLPNDDENGYATVSQQNKGYGSLTPTGQGIMETGRIAERIVRAVLREFEDDKT